MSIYFLGYLIWTSAITWHKVTWPKTSECKCTNTGATLKVLKNAVSSICIQVAQLGLVLPYSYSMPICILLASMSLYAYMSSCPCIAPNYIYALMLFNPVLLTLIPLFGPYSYRGGALGRRRVSTLL
jgi:hypothetical protein